MTTPGRDRLAALFEGMTLPTLPPGGTQTYAETELEAQMTGQSVVEHAPSASYSKRPSPTRKPASIPDALTSSDDEDDYVAAFRTKPTMKTLTPNNPHSAKSGITTQSPLKNSENLDLNAGLTQPLSSVDKRGYSVTGHFCPFNMVTKFPYKYMDDANGRVSRHFFANGKIFEREWDL